ncbi:hypothetical protein [Gorillibacterium sp. sgz5001074]|uniref:hypothetical protein n=1 Tax=Gorillibacterium sp. sgz5001074 TaxID=3446695 RepID=UPI003F678231
MERIIEAVDIHDPSVKGVTAMWPQGDGAGRYGCLMQHLLYVPVGWGVCSLSTPLLTTIPFTQEKKEIEKRA